MTEADTAEIVPNGGHEGNGWDAPLGRWTFKYTPALKIVRRHMHGKVLNACAGKTELRHDGETVRNDINAKRKADTHHDVAQIEQHFESGSFDTVVFDPPFDQSQADDKYDGMHASDIHAAFNGFNEITTAGSVVITFGWNSWGMQSFPAFEREKTYLLQRGPTNQDVIVSVDRRTSGSIGDYNND